MSDRRPLRFWQPFNDWWRNQLDKSGRRASAQEIVMWYHANAQELWGDDAPSIQETRVHAKCLRSLPLVRDYFRSYRAKKRGSRGSGNGDDDDYDEEETTGEGEDDGTIEEQQPTLSQQQQAGRQRNSGKRQSNGTSAAAGGHGYQHQHRRISHVQSAGAPGSGPPPPAHSATTDEINAALASLQQQFGMPSLPGPAPGMPSFPPMMMGHPSHPGMWPPGMPPAQGQPDLMSSLAMLHAQHSMALQQQCALASLAHQIAAAQKQYGPGAASLPFPANPWAGGSGPAPGIPVAGYPVRSMPGPQMQPPAAPGSAHTPGLPTAGVPTQGQAVKQETGQDAEAAIDVASSLALLAGAATELTELAGKAEKHVAKGTEAGVAPMDTTQGEGKRPRTNSTGPSLTEATNNCQEQTMQQCAQTGLNNDVQATGGSSADTAAAPVAADIKPANLAQAFQSEDDEPHSKRRRTDADLACTESLVEHGMAAQPAPVDKPAAAAEPNPHAAPIDLTAQQRHQAQQNSVLSAAAAAFLGMAGPDGGPFPGMGIGSHPAAFFQNSLLMGSMGSFFTGAYPNPASMLAAAYAPRPAPVAEPVPSGGIFSAAAVLRAGQAAAAPPTTATAQPPAAGVAVGAAAAITLSGASPTQSVAEGGCVSEPTSSFPPASNAQQPHEESPPPAAVNSPAKPFAPVAIPSAEMFPGAIADGVVDVKWESTTDALARPLQVKVQSF